MSCVTARYFLYVTLEKTQLRKRHDVQNISYIYLIRITVFNFESIVGVQHWNRPNNAATGQAMTLYERHPHTAENAGNPIADTFAVVARKNSAILVLGDGVNWGAKAALASRCAVHGCMEHLNSALFTSNNEAKVLTTQV